MCKTLELFLLANNSCKSMFITERQRSIRSLTVMIKIYLINLLNPNLPQFYQLTCLNLNIILFGVKEKKKTRREEKSNL